MPAHAVILDGGPGRYVDVTSKSLRWSLLLRGE